MEGCASNLMSWCCPMLGSSVIDNMLRVLSFFLFPTRRHFFRSNKPCITVCQIITFNSLGFFIFYKLIQVVFPSLCWYSCFSLCSCRDDKSWVPLGSSFGPSFWSLCAIRKAWRHFSFFCVSTQFVMLQVDIFSTASYSIQSSNSSPGLMCFSVSF